MTIYKLGSNTGKEEFSSFSEKGLIGGKIITTSETDKGSKQLIAYKVKENKDPYKKAMLTINKASKIHKDFSGYGEEEIIRNPHQSVLTRYKKSGEEKKKKF